MNFLDNYFKYDSDTEISGLTNELSSFYVLRLFKKINRNVIVLTSSLYESNKIYNRLINMLDNVLLFPMDDFLSSMMIAESPELKYKRLETLEKLKSNDKYIIVTNLMGYLKYLPSINTNNVINIKVSDEIKRDELIKKLVELGYNKESLVTASGEYAVRGFIMDIYPIDNVHPVRLEFDGDVIESIRYFSEFDQISMGKLDNINIKAIDEIITDDKSSLIEYANNPMVVYIDKSQINASYKKLHEDILEYKTSKEINDDLMYSLEDFKTDRIYLNMLSNGKNNINSKSIINYKEDFNKLREDIFKYKRNGKEVIFCLDNDEQKKKIIKEIPDAKVVIESIGNGFIIDKYVLIGSLDIEEVNTHRSTYKNNYHMGKKITNFNDIQKGDYVVHLAHGIGIYDGIRTLKVRGFMKDFLEIHYEGNDKVFVPVEKIGTIYKYTGKDGSAPKINKLGTSSWEKTKKYVQSKVKDISQELIKLYQKRLTIKRKPYKDYPEELVFGSEFQYTLTKDQEKSIRDINEDLKKDTPMDRLLCGDVGFGKTEVAMRAAFKTILNNEQVLYLCPTTILSHQQYNVAIDRLKKWPIEVALLNRHVSTKKTKEILNELKSGRIDMLIGTHRILSDDIVCKNLGLVIIDEEQRFGVSFKEKLKKLNPNVNILTLSATPIPRTLKMALSGMRDLSIIDTPPVNRYPVQTYVVLEDDLIIKDAIYKELSRNGQVFILYNKVESIEEYLYHIKSLVPDANIGFAHGQMTKERLESIMNSFINREYDILICTTIIESGIDIPNVNTLIIHSSDNFGLSQLYQLRGRVGRSDRIAYAYLLYDKDKLINETAVKRLNAIKEFTELGSGYKIAMRDLNIRGAGDIFGSSQSGFVDSVGINLYMKMIEDEVNRLNGKEVYEETNNTSLINVNTSISSEYVADEDIKIEIHQKINEIDSYSKLLEIKNELEDRFGKISQDLLIYMYEEWFEKIAYKYEIKKVNQTDRSIEIVLPESVSNNIKGDKLLMEAMSLTKNFYISYKNKEIVITLYTKNLDKHFIFYIVNLLEKIL